MIIFSSEKQELHYHTTSSAIKNKLSYDNSSSINSNDINGNSSVQC